MTGHFHNNRILEGQKVKFGWSFPFTGHYFNPCKYASEGCTKKEKSKKKKKRNWFIIFMAFLFTNKKYVLMS